MVEIIAMAAILVLFSLYYHFFVKKEQKFSKDEDKILFKFHLIKTNTRKAREIKCPRGRKNNNLLKSFTTDRSSNCSSAKSSFNMIKLKKGISSNLNLNPNSNPYSIPNPNPNATSNKICPDDIGKTQFI
jgi:hypothetical protein